MTSDKSWSNKISSIEIRKKVDVPSRFDWVKTNPDDSEMDDINANDTQGIANDGSNWFICNYTTIYKWEKNNMKKIITRTSTGDLPSAISSYNHFGDMDFENGYPFFDKFVLGGHIIPPEVCSYSFSWI